MKNQIGNRGNNEGTRSSWNYETSRLLKKNVTLAVADQRDLFLRRLRDCNGAPSRQSTATPNSVSLSLMGSLAVAARGSLEIRLKSELGQSLPKWGVRATSAFPPVATELRTSQVVRFVPKGDIPIPYVTGPSSVASRDQNRFQR